jgi:hypothetical protein
MCEASICSNEKQKQTNTIRVHIKSSFPHYESIKKVFVGLGMWFSDQPLA